MKNAVILAAGLGKRLMPLTEDKPKCLIEIDEKPMLYYSVAQLIANGVKQISFVTGYREETIQPFVVENFGQTNAVFGFIYNEEYATKNNLYSVYCAKNFFDDETLLLNSDILYHPDILESAVSAIDEMNESFLVVDNYKKLAEEEMKVKLDKKTTGRIVEIGKWLPPAESFGEYIGILHLKGKGREIFFEEAERMLYNGEDDKYYEDALHRVCPKINLGFVSTQNKVWTEVDDFDDLEKAKNIIKEIKEKIHRNVS
ncbi:MAG: phosphocholine cytidylyltransferase family protein [Candidatus Schekmanbacteria bacterium]|nr:MAG: phosphocholine cytidylyltransferase family protein [Candidatus Schekmanbacteria bacterium]